MNKAYEITRVGIRGPIGPQGINITDLGFQGFQGSNTQGITGPQGDPQICVCMLDVDFTDAGITGVSDSDYLRYDGNTGIWKNQQQLIQNIPLNYIDFSNIPEYLGETGPSGAAFDLKLFRLWRLIGDNTIVKLRRNPQWLSISNNTVTGRRLGQAAGTVNKFYIAGGSTATVTYSTDSFAYDIPTNTWTQTANLNNGRFGHAGAVCDGKFYIFGGRISPSGSVSASVEEYNPNTNSWSLKTSMPATRYAAAATTIGSKIYVYGGTVDGSNAGAANTCYEYTPATNTWATKATMPARRTALYNGFTVNNKAYAVCGNTTAGTVTQTVYEYNPATNSWATKNNFPGTAREWINAFNLNNYGYVLAGSRPPGSFPGDYFDDMWKYNGNTDSWEEVEPSNAGVLRRYGFTGNTSDGLVALYGGGQGLIIYNIWEKFQ